jgi:hypothetical protein
MENLCIATVGEASGGESEGSSGGQFVKAGPSKETKARGKEVVPAGEFDEAEWDWMGDFDWDGDLREWEMGKIAPVNRISALFGSLKNCPGFTIKIGNVNFKC